MSATNTSQRASDPGRTTRLRREVFPPRASATTAAGLLAGSALAGFAAIVAGIGLATSAVPQPPARAPAVVHIVHTGDARPGASTPALGEPSTPEVALEELPPGAEASLAMQVGERAYAVLDDAPQRLLDAASFELVGDARAPEAAVAAVSADDLSDELAEWSGREVVVGGRCEARVRGFALVSPMRGSIDYMPLETWEPGAAGIIETLLGDAGEPVLAAELDGCAQDLSSLDPAVVRDAALAPAVRAVRVDRPSLEARAEDRLLGSDAARQAQRDYAGVRDDAAPWWTLPSAEIEVEALRHPETGELWVSATASANEGCGFATVNLWGLYRVRGGELEPVGIRSLQPGARLVEAVDVDGDGELSFLASRMYGSSALLEHGGDERAAVRVPFFGCPC